jgi:hypothetical protein
VAKPALIGAPVVAELEDEAAGGGATSMRQQQEGTGEAGE